MKKIFCLLVCFLLIGNSYVYAESPTTETTGLENISIPEDLAESPITGTTGECFWELEESILTISGNGRMEDYTLDNKAPWNSEDFTEVIINQGVENIGDCAFDGKYKMEKITIPDSVVSIGFSSFSFCSGLESISLPEGLTYIGASAFNWCEFKRITLPDSLEKIGNYAFSRCEKLNEIVIGKGLEKIGDYAFNGCKNIDKVYIADLATWFNILFQSKHSNPIAASGGDVYLNGETIKYLDELVVPEGIKNINDYAVLGLYPKNITIPFSVKFISDDAFPTGESLTINCYYASYAKAFAIQKGFPYSIIRVDFDATGDGVVNRQDIECIRKNIFKDGDISPDGDCNKDGIINICDLVNIYVNINPIL